MKSIKKVIKNIIGEKIYNVLSKIYIYIFNLYQLIFNNFRDSILYYKHSIVFSQNTFNKIEARIILHYHSIEKGFLQKNFKYRFAIIRVKELIKLLNLPIVIKNYNKTQIAAAYLAICKYYEKHSDNNIDISDYYNSNDYAFFKSFSILKKNIVENHSRASYFANTANNFYLFSNSRKSIRSYTGEKIPLEIIYKVIEIAKTAPSVCNRQPCKVYYLENKKRIDKILAIQGGLTGYTNKISQLFILTSDRNYFYTVGERNQLYVDGGIFLMNLLYALHYYKIGACPAHWGHNYKKDILIKNELKLNESEKVISIIPFGKTKEEFKTTLSLRREVSEIMKVIK